MNEGIGGESLAVFALVQSIEPRLCAHINISEPHDAPTREELDAIFTRLALQFRLQSDISTLGIPAKVRRSFAGGVPLPAQNPGVRVPTCKQPSTLHVPAYSGVVHRIPTSRCHGMHVRPSGEKRKQGNVPPVLGCNVYRAQSATVAGFETSAVAVE